MLFRYGPTVTKGFDGQIKIGVIGPVGLAHWSPSGMKEGAEMARDEINAAGGVNIGGSHYEIVLAYGDEHAYPTADPVAAANEMTRLCDPAEEGCDFVIGGFTNECTTAMVEVAADYAIPFFIDGACADELVNDTVGSDYARYKYLFRVNPANSTMNMMTLASFYQYILAGSLLPKYGEYLWPEAPNPQVRVAVLSEDLDWTLKMHTVFSDPAIYPFALGPYANVTYADRVPSLTTDLTPWLSNVIASEARLLIHLFSGETGVCLIVQSAAMGIEAIPVGMNVFAQLESYWEATSGLCEYETIINVAGTGTPIIPGLTGVFWGSFIGNYSAWPLCTAWGAYDCLNMLAEAIESTGSMDKDVLVAHFEDPSYERTGLSGRFRFDSTHDVYSSEFGPHWTEGFSRPFVVQWQAGKHEVVWPVDQPYSKQFLPWMPTRISISDVNPSKSVVGQGYAVLINVTVENQGDFSTIFGVAAPYLDEAPIPAPGEWHEFWSLGDVNNDGYIDETDVQTIADNFGWEGPPGENPADINSDGVVNLQDAYICGHNCGLEIWAYFGLPTPISGTQRGLRLHADTQATLTFTWNTTGFDKGNYTIAAKAHYDDFTDGWVIVAMVGDLSGPDGWPDGKCDIRDIALVALYFGQDAPPAPANCDLTGPTKGLPDGKVDIRDIATVAIRFGEIDP